MNSTRPGISKRVPSLRRLLLLVVLALAVAPLTAFDDSCGGQKDDLVVILYRPLVNFRLYDNGAGKTSISGEGAVFTAYKIISITNKGKDASDFTFQPSKIYIKGPKDKKGNPTDFYGNATIATSPLALNLDGYLISLSFSQVIHPDPSPLVFDNGPQVRILITDHTVNYTPSDPNDTEKVAYGQLQYNPGTTGARVSMVPDGSLPKYFDVGTPNILAENK
jgi:hypothetical protein